MSQQGGQLAPGIKGYHQWQKAILTDPELAAMAKAARENRGGGTDLRLIGLAMAKNGANGRGSFVSPRTIATELDYNVKTVEKGRDFLIGRGWFGLVSKTAGRNHRGWSVDIGLPDLTQHRPVLKVVKPAKIKPARKSEPKSCQAQKAKESTDNYPQPCYLNTPQPIARNDQDDQDVPSKPESATVGRRYLDTPSGTANWDHQREQTGT